jgi:hypothetical protein
MKDNIYNITLIDLEQYIKNHGWTKVNDYISKKNVLYRGFENDQGHPLEMFVPVNTHFNDFYLRLRDIVSVLAVIQKRTVSEIINDITRSNRDIFRISVPNAGQGGIPLSYAADSVNAIKNLYMYAASSEVISLPFFDKPILAGQHHASICEFDHTFQGSFGFTINSPVTSDIQLVLFDKVDIPFERRVMERIVRSLDLIQKSVDNHDADILVNNYDIGLNSRMCESLLDLSNNKTKNIELNVDWSYRFEVSEDIKNKFMWHLSEEAYLNIEYAANELKKIEPQILTIIGTIITLHSTRNPVSDDNFTGQVTVKTRYDNRAVDVKVSLGKDGYAVALDAHGRGARIKITGMLFKKGNSWKMVEVEDINLFL